MRKVKKWSVVSRKGNFYKNLAVKIRFKKYYGNYFILINPRLLFTSNGKRVLKSDELAKTERSFRKSFMKNDFLRRRFNVIFSYITESIKNPEQTNLSNFSNKGRNQIKVKERFYIYVHYTKKCRVIPSQNSLFREVIIIG